VYNAAALGIVFDTENNTQTFFNNHTDDIISMDMHPDGVLVATGELGPKPYIFVWDSETMEIKNQWKGAILKGVAAVAFSPSGNKLVAAAIDDDHFIGVFDLVKNSFISFKVDIIPT
jgi:echinoderm microtubule-associated protein-like 6